MNLIRQVEEAANESPGEAAAAVAAVAGGAAVMVVSRDGGPDDGQNGQSDAEL